MPELPDVELYLHALRSRIVGQRLEQIRIASPFLVRTVHPPLSAVEGQVVSDLRRIGKRIVWSLDDELFVVIHLMIAGRFRWMPGNAALVPDFYERFYVQHNPDMPDGYERILEVVQTNIRAYIDRTGGAFPVTIHRVGGEGDLVFMHSSIFMAGINRNEGVRSTNVDIFRVSRQGRMTEHWDVLQMQVEPVSRPELLF